MTSMPGVHSGGLNQCTPRKRAGSPTASASPPIGSEEVFEAMIAVAGAAAETRPRMSSLSACSSGTASITRSASPTAASRSGGVVTRAVAAVASSGSSPASTWPRVRSSNRSRACSASSGEASTSATRSPARARWPAMPPPIVPPPITATVSTPPGVPWGDRGYTGRLKESAREAPTKVREQHYADLGTSPTKAPPS